MRRYAPVLIGAVFIAACGGGGGDGQPADPSAQVTLSASPTTISPGQSTTLTWSSTNATSCTASGGWSGAKATSGTEQTGALSTTTTFTLACSGTGGSDTESVTVTVSAPGAGEVIVSGKITFDRVPFRTQAQAGLDPTAPIRSPARQVVVEAMDAGTNGAVASGVTDVNGDYALTVPVNRNIFIRARAQMLKTGAAPTWDFRVRNNANGDALYVLDGSPFDSGSANSTRDLHAPIAWNGSSYTNRTAAPFAILDTVYQAKELILAAAPTAAFAQLNLFWSSNNRPAAPFCPDDGNIITSSYVTFGGDEDECNTPQPGVDGIYILGEFSSNSDTDEFDQHVIAHEFGHYFEDRFSRSDSVGGSHGGADRLDLRVAFGEGWGNAYSAMALSNPAYRDSQSGVSTDFGFNLENDDQSGIEGWFSEFSVSQILFDVFDSGAEAGDAVALGFGPIYSVMTGPQVATDAFTSIFTFASALRSANPNDSSAIGALLDAEGVSGGADAFGDSEQNEGGVPESTPIYEIAASGALFEFCSRREAGAADANKLGNRKFFRLDVPGSGALVTIRVTGIDSADGSAATDPDIYVFKQGALAAFSNNAPPDPPQLPAEEILAQAQLSPGTHIVEIYDFDIDGSLTNRCMSATFSGI